MPWDLVEPKRSPEQPMAKTHASTDLRHVSHFTMSTPRLLACLFATALRLSAFFLVFLLPTFANAQVRRVTLGLHTTCPYGLVA